MSTIRSAVSSVSGAALFVSFELGKKEWKLGFTSGIGVTPWVKSIAAGDLAALQRALAAARTRGGLAAEVPIWSCYEAGREGFWLHRALEALGVRNRVVDSASIEVNRHARRAKTDHLDARKLVLMLVRVVSGEPGVWREVRVPTEAVEAARHVSRERSALVTEQTRLTNQIGSYLAACGCAVDRRARQRAQWWTAARDWKQALLPAPIQERIARAEARLALVAAQIAALEEAQAAAVAAADHTSALGRLVQLKGVATTGASTVLAEGLVWRGFRNRREIGGLLGFAPTPYNSGTVARDQGIRRAGNKRLQAVSIQLAWNWVRWQPASALTRWYQAQFAGLRRMRRVGIVALARKLLIALWRYAVEGIVPAGAVLKPAPTHS